MAEQKPHRGPERRRGERRQSGDRRDEVRWEPESTNRRDGFGRRVTDNLWASRKRQGK